MRKQRKLSLSSETLRHLEPSFLKRPAGGFTNPDSGCFTCDTCRTDCGTCDGCTVQPCPISDGTFTC